MRSNGVGDDNMKKSICLLVAAIFLNICTVIFLIAYSYASTDKQTDWWDLKKHWDTCTTKDHELDLEYMSRVAEYYYTVPHKTPISKVAVLPPPASDKFTLNSLVLFEKNVLFNTTEMKSEYRIVKKWITDKSFKESYRILKDNNLYDKYQAWVDEFITYRTIDKDLFLKMADVLKVDTFLVVLIGYDRPGAAGSTLQSELYNTQIGALNVFLFNTKEGAIVWEYVSLLGHLEESVMTQWKGIYRFIYKIMPVE